MADMQEGSKVLFRITKVTVIKQSGTDQLRIETTLPLGVYPYKGFPQTLSLEVTKGMGEQYVRDNFKIEPEVIVI